MEKKNMKPPLYSKGHTLFITSAFPPTPGGSCVLNQNLLSLFDETSYTVITRNSGLNKIKANNSVNVRRVLMSLPSLGKYDNIFVKLQLPWAKFKIKKIAKRKKIKLIIGTYPNLFFLNLADELANEIGVPFIPYLHDTIYEANIGSKNEYIAKGLNYRILNNRSCIFVMSDGMVDLYKRKYGVQTIALRHTYLEKNSFKEAVSDFPKQFFWGGAIYDINRHTISVLSNHLYKNGLKIELATSLSKTTLEKMRINLQSCDITFYPYRTDYLNAIQTSDILVLALDPQSHSMVHFDEIGTIFPTKTPEYLASGKPILVICPKEYFLAKYFREHNCGFVYELADLDNFTQILADLSNQNEVKLKVNNAINMLNEHFLGSKVRDILINNLQQI